jgi:hypothetical protein
MQFAERLAAKPDSAELETIAARLEASADEHESLGHVGRPARGADRRDGVAR